MRERDNLDQAPKKNSVWNRVVTYLRLPGERLTLPETFSQYLARANENIGTLIALHLALERNERRLKDLGLDEPTKKIIEDYVKDEVRLVKLEEDANWLKGLNAAGIDIRKKLKAWDAKQKLSGEEKEARNNPNARDRSKGQ